MAAGGTGRKAAARRLREYGLSRDDAVWYLDRAAEHGASYPVTPGNLTVNVTCRDGEFTLTEDHDDF